MMVCFGGRDANGNTLNDTWGLRKHRDGRWDWVKAPIKKSDSSLLPKGRYQHRGTFIGSLLAIIGGRSDRIDDNLPLQVYDTETSEWHNFDSIQTFRHTCWSTKQSIFLYGGFMKDVPNVPVSTITEINLE